MNNFRKFLCNILDWHKPSYMVIKGVNTYSYCRYCDKEIMRDSQGNWFSVGGSNEKRNRRIKS